MKTRTLDDFKSLPEDEETKTLKRVLIKTGNYYALFEKWSWEGIIGNSLIFCNEDIINLTDEELSDICRGSGFYTSGEILIKRQIDSGYTFANFSFTT